MGQPVKRPSPHLPDGDGRGHDRFLEEHHTAVSRH